MKWCVNLKDEKGDAMELNIIVQCGIKINDEYWFAVGNMNGLFKKNLLTDEVIFVGFFANEEKLRFRAYTDVQLINNKLIFTPCLAKEIAIYDLEEKKFYNMQLPIYESGINQYMKSVKYKDTVYFIPFYASLFIKYCAVENNIKKLDKWTELRKQYLNYDNKNLVIESICTDDDYIYMFMSSRNDVIILNMATDQFEVKRINILSPTENICSVCKFKKHIWIASSKGKIYVWDYINNSIVKTIDIAQYIDYKDDFIHHILLTNRYIYLINNYEKNIRAFDYIRDKFMVIDMNKYVSEKKDDNLSLYYYYDIRIIENNKISVYSFYDNKYILIDGDEIANMFSVNFPVEDYLVEYLNEEILLENRFIYVTPFILEKIYNMLEKNVLSQNRKPEKKIGKMIHDTLLYG